MTTEILRVEDISNSSKQKLIGLAFACIAVLIWSIYFLSLRFGALSSLNLEDLALFRYAIPGILLFPIFIKSIKDYKKVPIIYLLGITVGSGLAFFLLSAYGMQLTPVVYGSTLVPGTTPLFVSLIAVVIYKQNLSYIRKYGLISIALGIVVMLIQAKSGSMLNTDLLLGQGIFIFCALLWAFFTLSIRQASLAPLKVAALAAFPNAVIIIIWTISTQEKFGYMDLEISEIITQMLVQGILVGIISGMCFAAAISRIGAETSAAIGAMTPAVATFIASISLNEQMNFSLILAMFLIMIGVLLASGIFKSKKES